ncbi:MAG: hypothetical protein KAR44_12600 [Candidatus Aegiribacteria sp.]|nr:hypothetical protein [Candidatus Aegiribacteria sp.]
MVQSYFVRNPHLLYEYFEQDEFRSSLYDKLAGFLLENPEAIIDLEADRMKRELNLTQNQFFFALEKMALAGVIGAKVRWYFIGVDNMEFVSGEIVPPWQSIRRRVTRALRRELLERADYRCQVDSCPFCNNQQLGSRRLHIDHLIPFSIMKNAQIEPDANPENLRVFCARLNIWKSNKAVRELHMHRPLPPPLITGTEWCDLKASRRRHPLSQKQVGLLYRELNRDSLRIYLSKEFPDLKYSMSKHHTHLLFEEINISRWRTIGDIHALLARTKKAWSKYKTNTYAQSALAHLAIALACEDDKFRQSLNFSGEAARIIADFRGESSDQSAGSDS